MMKSDDLLNEDTNHIVDKVNHTHKEEVKKELSYNTQLIITIIVGILVIYCGGYTLYYVYLVPSTNKVGQVEENVEWNIAEDLVSQVPYSVGESVIYNDYGVTSIKDVETDFILSFLIDSLETSEYMSISSCEEGENCIEVTTQTINNKYLNYYGTSLSEFPETLTTSNGLVCELSGLIYDCKGLSSDSYSGKISVVESVKETDEYYYIYETALFVSNLSIVDNNMSFDYISTKPSISSAIEQNSNYTVSSTDMTTEIYNLFSNKSYIYMHTFIKDNDNYYWSETQVVTTLP